MHLGALHTKKSYFDVFLSNLLNKLDNGELPHLKALCILGDCFDLIMDTYRDLLSFGLYTEILDKFEVLYQREDIKLLFALGNHEISVVGDYNNSFPDNKKKMLRDFNEMQKKIGLDYNFFSNDAFSQYILLQPGGHDEPEPCIKTFDSEQDIFSNSTVTTLDLDVPRVGGLGGFLMSHGFQYDPDLEKYSGIWDLGLANPFSLLKQLGDVIWNGFLKKIYDKSKMLVYYVQDEYQGKRDKIIKKEKKRIIKKHEDVLEPLLKEEENMLKLDNNLKIKWDSDQHREAIRENQGCINNIASTIPNYVNNGIPISHVIFGHTHDKLRPTPKWYNAHVRESPNQFQVQVFNEQGQFEISNTGAWQHVKKPSYIEILFDWKVQPPRTGSVELQKVEKVVRRPLLIKEERSPK